MANFHIHKADDFEFDAPIVKETYDLYKLFYEYSESFPKRVRYTIGLRCENHILDFLELLLHSTSTGKQEKLKTLEQANAKFDTLKLLIRLLKDIEVLDTQKYVMLETKIQKIGQQLGGWIRSLR